MVGRVRAAWRKNRRSFDEVSFSFMVTRDQISIECERLGKQLPDEWKDNDEGFRQLRDWFYAEWKMRTGELSPSPANLMNHFIATLKAKKEKEKIDAILYFFRGGNKGDDEKLKESIVNRAMPNKPRALSDFLKDPAIRPHLYNAVFLFWFSGKLIPFDKQDKSDGHGDGNGDIVDEPEDDKLLPELHEFLDREDQLNFLKKHFNDNKKRLVMVGGQKGYGKTVLVKNFIKRVTLKHIAGHVTLIRFKPDRLIVYEYFIRKKKPNVFVEGEKNKKEEKYDCFKTLDDWKHLMLKNTFEKGKRHLIVLDDFEHVMNENFDIKYPGLQEFIELFVSTGNDGALIIMTTQVFPIFSDSFTGRYGARMREIRLEKLPLDAFIKLFKSLDDDPEVGYGIKDASDKLLMKLHHAFNGRPKSIVNCVADLKRDHRRLELLDDINILSIALKYEDEIFNRFSDLQKKMLVHIAGSKQPLDEKVIYKKYPADKHKNDLRCLDRCDAIKLLDDKTKREYTVHPLMQKYLEEYILQGGQENKSES